MTDLPQNWRHYPAPDVLKQIGAEWYQAGAAAVLAVPSAIVPQEENYLINPEHREFRHVVIHEAVPFQLDPRMPK